MNALMHEKIIEIIITVINRKIDEETQVCFIKYFYILFFI